MKKSLATFAIAAVAATALYTLPVFAEGPSDDQPCPPPPGARQHHEMGCPMDRMLADLNLTDEQKQKVQPILDAFKAKMKKKGEARKAAFEARRTSDQKAARQDGKKARPELSAEQKAQMKAARKADKAEMKADFDALKAQLKPILTDEQYQKLEKLAKRHGGKHQGKHQGKRGPDGERFDRPVPPPPPSSAMMQRHLVRQLELSEEQATKLEPILKKFEAQHQARMEEQRKADQAEREALKAEINKILTADQQEDLDEAMQPPHRGHHPGHHRGHHPGPSPEDQPEPDAE